MNYTYFSFSSCLALILKLSFWYFFKFSRSFLKENKSWSVDLFGFKPVSAFKASDIRHSPGEVLSKQASIIVKLKRKKKGKDTRTIFANHFFLTKSRGTF